MDKDTIFAVFFPLFIASVGLYHTSRLRRVKLDTKSWLTTQGRILDFRIVGFGKARSALVLYEFTVNTKLIGSRICAPGCELSDPAKYRQKYAVGCEILVHYDPSDPQNCMLELPSEMAIRCWTTLVYIGFTFPLLYLIWLEYIESWMI